LLMLYGHNIIKCLFSFLKKFLHFLIALLLSHCMIKKKFKLLDEQKNQVPSMYRHILLCVY